MKLVKSDRKSKKYMLIIGNKKIHFGAKGYEDYTTHKDKERRRLYRLRHKPILKNSKVLSPAYLSYYILWGPYTDLTKNFNYYKNRFLIN